MVVPLSCFERPPFGGRTFIIITSPKKIKHSEMTVGRDLAQGFEAVEKKVSAGHTACDEFCAFIKGRIAVETQSAKGLTKLSSTSEFMN